MGRQLGRSCVAAVAAPAPCGQGVGSRQVGLAHRAKRNPGGVPCGRDRSGVFGHHRSRRSEEATGGGYSHEAVIKRLSLPRFAPYETVTSDRAAALALYEWNADASAVVFHAIGMLEVLLRNSLSDVLGQMFPAHGP